jgi:hypothetical protein
MPCVNVVPDLCRHQLNSVLKTHNRAETIAPIIATEDITRIEKQAHIVNNKSENNEY